MGRWASGARGQEVCPLLLTSRISSISLFSAHYCTIQSFTPKSDFEPRSSHDRTSQNDSGHGTVPDRCIYRSTPRSGFREARESSHGRSPLSRDQGPFQPVDLAILLCLFKEGSLRLAILDQVLCCLVTSCSASSDDNKLVMYTAFTPSHSGCFLGNNFV